MMSSDQWMMKIIWSWCAAHLVSEERSGFAVVFILQAPAEVIVVLQLQEHTELPVSSHLHLLQLQVLPLVHRNRPHKAMKRSNESLTNECITLEIYFQIYFRCSQINRCSDTNWVWPEVDAQASVFARTLQTDPDAIRHADPLRVKGTALETHLTHKHACFQHTAWEREDEELMKTLTLFSSSDRTSFSTRLVLGLAIRPETHGRQQHAFIQLTDNNGFISSI